MALTIITPTSYADANEARVNEGALTRLNSGSASNVANLDIVLTAYLAFPILKLFVYNHITATSTAAVNFRISTDGGSTFIAASYWMALEVSTSNGGAATTNSETATSIQIGSGSQSAVSSEALCGEITIYNPNNATYKPQLAFQMNFWTSATHTQTGYGTASHNTAELINAVRFINSSGNITSMNWILAGMKV